MASSDVLPRFFSIFISQYSSNSLMIPCSYYAHLPRRLPKTAILMGAGGKVWKVAMMSRRDQVFCEQGWGNFVTDNELNDGEFLAFVFDGHQSFEVSIYGHGVCKEIRAAIDVEEISDGTEGSLHSVNIIDDDDDETEFISEHSPDNFDITSIIDEADEEVITTMRSRPSSDRPLGVNVRQKRDYLVPD